MNKWPTNSPSELPPPAGPRFASCRSFFDRRFRASRSCLLSFSLNPLSFATGGGGSIVGDGGSSIVGGGGSIVGGGAGGSGRAGGAPRPLASHSDHTAAASPPTDPWGSKSPKRVCSASILAAESACEQHDPT